MSTTVLRALVVSSSLVAILLSVGGVVALVRWRRRHPDVQQQISRYTAVSRTLRRGGTVVDGDRAMGVLVAEQLTLNSLPLLGTLLLCASQVVRALARPDDSTGLTLVLMLVAISTALGGLTLCARGLLTARRQGIRPGRLW